MKFSAVKSSTLNSRVPLLLHFDINKTIIITDSALDLSIDQALNSLLSECIWGTLKKNRDQCEAGSTSGLRGDKMTGVEVHPRSYLKTGTRNEDENSDENVDNYKWSVSDWKICSPLPSKNAPQADSVTFNEFVENFHFDGKMTKTERRQFKRRFTQKGMPGEEALESFRLLEESMKFPAQSLEIKNSEISDKKRKADLVDNLMDNHADFYSESNMGQMLKSGYYHILPSFFKLVSYLHQLDVDFRIIFRTFGIDVEKVSEEFNIYCEGKHPLFPVEKNPRKIENNLEYHTVERVAMDGENGIDRRLHFPYFCGAIKRTSEGPEGMSLSHTNVLGVSTYTLIFIFICVCFCIFDCFLFLFFFTFLFCFMFVNCPFSFDFSLFYFSSFLCFSILFVHLFLLPPFPLISIIVFSSVSLIFYDYISI
jgi:hypothetical protein